jgi:undecaprenyl-diphosphatase
MVDQKKLTTLGRTLGWPSLTLGLMIGLGWAGATFPEFTLWDQAALIGLHHYATPALDRAVLGFTDLGTVWGVLPGTILLAVVMIGRQQGQQATFLILAMLGALLLNLELKALWQRARPSLWEGIPLLPDHSFPSGHATLSMAFFLAVVLISQTSPHRRWIVLLGGLLALLIGLSRPYLGVHYVSDVVGGWLLAFGWTVGLYRVMFPSALP